MYLKHLALAGIALLFSQAVTDGTRWWAHIEYLAADSLQGRDVGSEGFEKAATYVERQFEAIGLKPAGVTGYRQPVIFESRRLVPDQSQLALVRDGQEEPLVLGQDASLSARGELNGALEAPMVFVGYGMSIPEASWDDLAGLDLHGKVAVYVNMPAPADVPANVRSHLASAAERWAVLKRAGAIGIATISALRAPAVAATPPRPDAPSATSPTAGSVAAPAAATTTGVPSAGRGAAGGRAGAGTAPPTISLADPELRDEAGQAVSISVTAAGAAKFLAGSGHTLDELAQLAAANKPLPRFPLTGTLRAKAALERTTIASANVIGMIEGTDPTLKGEYVVMSAHLDHVGVGRPVNGDSIYNGAMDDASGVASVIEIARLLTEAGTKTKRSVIFMAQTGEEKGLLGSRYFAARPTVPFKQIVADINLDMFLPLYPLKVIEVQGLTESSLGETVREAAKEVGVDVQTDREPEQNRFIRSDQYSFIRAGIPSLAFKFGYVFGSPEEKIRRDWVRDIYHKPSDDLNQPVDIEAAARFDRVIMGLLTRVANAATRPAWNDDSFFKRFAKP